MYLNCHTVFSFRYGTLHPEQLIREAIAHGIDRITVTDINTTAAVIETVRLCAQHRKDAEEANGPPFQLEVAAGVEFRRDDVLLYVALARNQDGFEEISKHLSACLAGTRPWEQRAPHFTNSWVIYPYGSVEPGSLYEYEFIGIRRREINRFRMSAAAREFPDRCVALLPVSYSGKIQYNMHRLLRAMAQNTLLSKLRPEQTAHADDHMRNPNDENAAFAEVPDLIRRADELMKSCTLDFDLGTNKNKAVITGSSESDWAYLVEHATAGFRKKYPDQTPELSERFNRELRIIREKNFCAYYLVAYDLIRYADDQGFDHIGRGSGANSMVAYCLGITNVDPVELDLYFERFLNPERSSPPDFDLDFAWDQRDRIYDYLFRRYGTTHTCLLGTHTTLQERSVVRELGKVFGLPKEEIDQLTDEQTGARDKDHITSLIFRYAERMKDLPTNISIHAGGVLITEKPIHRWTPTTLPPKGYPVSHIDMHHAEDAGIYKFDILSQRGLGHLREAVRLVAENRSEQVDITRISDFQRDPAIRALLRSGKTIGCFYVESPAMRMLLRKLRCEDYRTLVAASSIIRPGVARSGMMRAYIERFHLSRAGKSWPAVHPVMNDILSETFGVMVYQEDVIKVAHLFAGLTLAEADILRRGMSGKFRSRREFERIRETFMRNCLERGYPQDVTDRVWYEIESFSGYSFAKGHSASYAVESYQSLFLKAHYPLEFMVGVINNFGGFYRTEFYFHEARMSGALIEAPCVNTSQYRTTLRGKHLYTGFIHLASLENQLAVLIPTERENNGTYQSISDFLNRIPAGPEQLRILIRSGAFRFTGKSKQELMWEALLANGERRTRSSSGTASLFEQPPADLPLPKLERHPMEDILDEIELLGFPLQDPFLLLDNHTPALHLAADIPNRNRMSIDLTGYLVTTKQTSTADRKAMFFGTFLDRVGEFFDTVHFPLTAARYPFRGRGFYRIKGMVAEEFGVYTVNVSEMEKLPLKNVRDEWFRDTSSWTNRNGQEF